MSAPRPRRASRQGDLAACDPRGGCEIGDLFRLLSRARMLPLLFTLIEESQGPRRFVDLQRMLDASPNTLTERLKELGEAGLVSRRAYDEIPPRVEYEATPKALALRPVFQSLCSWADTHTLEVERPAPAAARA